MSDQFWLTKAQLKRIEPFFARTRGIPRVAHVFEGLATEIPEEYSKLTGACSAR